MSNIPRSTVPVSDEDEAANAAYGAVILRNSRIALAVVAIVLVGSLWGFDAAEFGSTGLGGRSPKRCFRSSSPCCWRHRRGASPKSRSIVISRTRSGTRSHWRRTKARDIGLSRLETLLPLIRMFLFITIVTITLMSVISAMGVNIGPLLAGAGIVGIAVGFGAQTLVRDILSGVFFLFDDAFRIGEYLDIGEGKGTVERMSIRALILRHQLGHIYTVPFGAIRRVANYSRDWMIMKLEVRVPFDTDLEQLRKIIKQVGAELKADPETGPMFLQPLKSQGVNRIDDSAFIVRVKFMARPSGEAFILRRHVFQHIQQAFQKNGIEFALRHIVIEGENGRAGVMDLALIPSDDELRTRA